MTGELNDTKLLLEEQTSRNNLLEKKQRKFDAEIGLLQEDKKQETAAREKLQREVDTLKAQKYGLEQQIHVSTISYVILAVAVFFFRKMLIRLFWAGKFVQVIIFEIDCAIFYTNLHELFCQFIFQTNW